MINNKSIDCVNKSKYKNFTIPLYDSYCFSNINGTIKELFNIKSERKLPIDVLNENNFENNKVIFFLVDAFGWCFYEKYKDYSKFLKEIEENGVVSKITSQFPSTTTAHVTTALSDKRVDEHGLYEWFYYDKQVDDIVTAFLFNRARDKEIGTLENYNIDIKEFLPQDSIFKILKENKIESKIYQPSYINNSIYTKTMGNFSKIIGYESYKDLFENLSINIKQDNKKEYIYVYLPEIDGIAHDKGCESKEFYDQMIKFLKALDKFYLKVKECEKISILISADHGQIETDLNNKRYINKIIPNIDNFLIKNSKGYNLPGGYCRDLFLKVKEESLKECKTLIEKNLKDEVEVLTYEQLIQYGFFKEGSTKLKERCGNILLLPKEKNNIWWHEKGVFEIRCKGVHGGASKEEMEIPFLYYSL
ncbi:MAG: alkaline phosphatase family protein [Clostridium baratii]